MYSSQHKRWHSIASYVLHELLLQGFVIDSFPVKPYIKGFYCTIQLLDIAHAVRCESQGRSKRSGWSGFGRITISQGKNKVPFYKKQVINKSTRVIFGLVQLVILRYSRQKKHIQRQKIIGRPRMQEYFVQHKVFYCAKIK